MLSSCHIYKKFEMPSDDPATSEYARVAAEAPDSSAYGNLQWQQVFTDPLLQDYISRALANNVNLENARLNIDIARANLLGAKLSYLPSLAFNPNGAGAKYNLPGASMTWTYTLPLAASWEIDVFGKILNNKRAAEVNVELQGDYAQAVRSQIIGGVASCYYSIATIESQLALSKQTSEIWAQSVQTMRDFKEAGRVTEAAVVQSEAQYYSILASISDLETALRQANNSMSLLLNEQPQTYSVPADARLEVPAILRDGIALREIAQRPDVRVAEKNLAAAYYNTNLARAAFYPGLTISAQGGFTNLLGSFIKNPGDWFIQLAGQLTAPLFASKAPRCSRSRASTTSSTPCSTPPLKSTTRWCRWPTTPPRPRCSPSRRRASRKPWSTPTCLWPTTRTPHTWRCSPRSRRSFRPRWDVFQPNSTVRPT